MLSTNTQGLITIQFFFKEEQQVAPKCPYLTVLASENNIDMSRISHGSTHKSTSICGRENLITLPGAIYKSGN